jgi:hypothetical protein
MRTHSEIENYFKDTFTNNHGIKTVIVGGYDKVIEATLNKIEYPALWIMSPFSRRRTWLADVPRWKWSIDGLILMFAEIGDDTKITQNFDDTQALGEAFISKLQYDADASFGQNFDFDDVDNVEEWQPKLQHGADNCNGWLIPFSIITT